MAEDSAHPTEQKVEKSNPLIYLPLFALASGLVFWAFASFFKIGVRSAKNAPPRPEAATAQTAAVDLSQLFTSTPDLAAKGKMLYAINCASCHGPSGRGDGDRAAELNPRPRNYTTEKFKFGNAPSQLWNTLKVGSPGTAMASFELLPAGDRIAIIHYIRTLIPNPANDPPDVMAKMSGGGQAPATGGSTTTVAAADSGPRIPIALALMVSAQAEGEIGKKIGPTPGSEGATIYGQKCASCHGSSGEGGKPIQKLALYPYIYAKAPSLQNGSSFWVRDKKEFEKIVVGGLVGKMMPGAVLTSSQLDALYRYVQALAQ